MKDRSTEKSRLPLFQQEEWQKLILSLDHSKQGWGMMEENLADTLAKDSDDEQRIEKAEKMA